MRQITAKTRYEFRKEMIVSVLIKPHCGQFEKYCLGYVTGGLRSALKMWIYVHYVMVDLMSGSKITNAEEAFPFEKFSQEILI